MHQNRKERRKLAKSFGLLSGPANREQKERAMQAGKQIKKMFDDDTENSIRNQLAEKESACVAGLVSSGMSEEDAKKVVAKNHELELKRLEKLATRKKKRSI